MTFYIFLALLVCICPPLLTECLIAYLLNELEFLKMFTYFKFSDSKSVLLDDFVAKATLVALLSSD